MVVAVINLLFTVLEQKSKVRFISEISEFSYLALGQILPKTRKCRKDFSQLQE